MSDVENLERWLGTESRHVQRRIRLIMLLDAADYVIITPISTARFHALTFLADVLSSVYDLAPTTGSILKRRTGPYFPELQWELDRLVGMGLVEVFELSPIVDQSRAYIDAAFALERSRCAGILSAIERETQLTKVKDFFQELASALSDIPDMELDATTLADATWESGPTGGLIDYAGWRARNYSRLGADRVGEIASEVWGKGNASLSPAAKINLYVRYMKRAANE